MSRVFNGDAHLNDDQLYLASDFLGFSDIEREYVSLIHQYERSTLLKKKKEIARKVAGIRQKHAKSESHLHAEPVQAQSEDINEYYLNPNMQLVHMFLTVERYRNNVKDIKEALGLCEENLDKILIALERLGLIIFIDHQYKVLKDHMHLPGYTTLQKACSSLLRLKAIDKTQKLDEKNTYNFSVVFSADAPTRQTIQKKFLEFLQSIEKIVQQAPSENVYQMDFDLFCWS